MWSIPPYFYYSSTSCLTLPPFKSACGNYNQLHRTLAPPKQPARPQPPQAMDLLAPIPILVRIKTLPHFAQTSAKDNRLWPKLRGKTTPPKPPVCLRKAMPATRTPLRELLHPSPSNRKEHLKSQHPISALAIRENFQITSKLTGGLLY